MFVFFVSEFSFSVISYIYSSEHNFFDVLLGDFFGIFKHIFERITTGNSTSQGYGTIGTFIITSILNFQKSTSPVSDRITSDIKISFFNLTRMYFSEIVFG